MFNRRLIFKILGTLLWVEAAFMSLCLILAVYHMESDIMAFALTIGITCLTGLVFRLLGRKATSALSRRDAYLLVTVVWVAFTAFGMLPFLIGGYIQHVTDAFFETMSGLTTTGATVIDKVEGLPHGILFWRSLTQWIGGLGIVFFTIAIIPSFVGGTVKVFAAEATGPIKSKMHPRLTTTAKALWGIYLLLTVVCALLFFLFGSGDRRNRRNAVTLPDVDELDALGGPSGHADVAYAHPDHYAGLVDDHQVVVFTDGLDGNQAAGLFRDVDGLHALGSA